MDAAESAQRTAKPPAVEDGERRAQDSHEDRAGGIVGSGGEDGCHDDGSYAKKDHPDPVDGGQSRRSDRGCVQLGATRASEVTCCLRDPGSLTETDYMGRPSVTKPVPHGEHPAGRRDKRMPIQCSSGLATVDGPSPISTGTSMDPTIRNSMALSPVRRYVRRRAGISL